MVSDSLKDRRIWHEIVAVRHGDGLPIIAQLYVNDKARQEIIEGFDESELTNVDIIDVLCLEQKRLASYRGRKSIEKPADGKVPRIPKKRIPKKRPKKPKEE